MILPITEELNRRVVLKLWSDVPNVAFGIDQAFDAGRQLWAKIEPVHGLTIRMGMQTAEVPTHLFWVRYTSINKPHHFTASHVFEWKGRRYRVMDAIDVEDAQRFTRVTVKDLGAIT